MVLTGSIQVPVVRPIAPSSCPLTPCYPPTHCPSCSLSLTAAALPHHSPPSSTSMNIKIKTTRPINGGTKRQVLSELFRLNVKCAGLTIKEHCLLFKSRSDEDTDLLFSENVLTSLSNIGCQPVLPPQLKAKRCVLLRNVDQLIYDHEPEEIATEIERQNTWAKVNNIHKIPAPPTIKIEFAKQEQATKCVNSGILMFHLSIHPTDIKPETHIDIKICYRCYKLNDHLSIDCPKNTTYKICSNCSSTDHIYHDCKSNFKKCINCDGNHATMAFRCPKRREIERQLRGSEMKSTTSNVVKQNLADTSHNIDHNVLLKSIILSNMCITIATLKESETPGKFNDCLNQLLQANNLPSFNMGDLTPPSLNPMLHQPSGMENNAESSSQAKSARTSSPAQRNTPTQNSSASFTAIRNQEPSAANVQSTPVNQGHYSSTPGTVKAKTPEGQAEWAITESYNTRNATASHRSRKLTLYKRRGQPVVTPKNIQTLIKDRQVIPNIGNHDELHTTMLTTPADVLCNAVQEIGPSKFNNKLRKLSQATTVSPK